MAGHPPHPRRALLRLTVFAVLGSTSWANVLDRGGTVRVSRQAPIREWHLYSVMFAPGAGDEVLLRSTNPAVAGARYSVVDERGFVGEAQVTAVQKITSPNPSCPEVYFEAHARYIPGPRRYQVEGDTLAIGPAPSALRAARVIERYPFRRLPPLAEGKQLWHVVDLDGGGDPELFMVDFECQDDHVVSRGTGQERCLELWSREGKRWNVVARARNPICN